MTLNDLVSHEGYNTQENSYFTNQLPGIATPGVLGHVCALQVCRCLMPKRDKGHDAGGKGSPHGEDWVSAPCVRIPATRYPPQALSRVANPELVEWVDGLPATLTSFECEQACFWNGPKRHGCWNDQHGVANITNL